MTWQQNVVVSSPEDSWALRGRLEAAGVKFNAYAERLIQDAAFAPLEPGSFLVAKISAADLGLSKPTTFADICAQAFARGLQLCPLALAAHLRLAYLDQPVGPYFTIASAKPETSENFPNGFYLRHHEGSLWLRGYRASDDWEYGLDQEFGFLVGV